MVFTLLRFGHPALKLNMENVDRIVSRDDLLEINYHDGSHILGYMIRVEEQ